MSLVCQHILVAIIFQVTSTTIIFKSLQHNCDGTCWQIPTLIHIYVIPPQSTDLGKCDFKITFFLPVVQRFVMHK